MISKLKHILLVITLSVTFLSCSSAIQINSLSEARYMIGDSDSEIHMKSGHRYSGKQLKFDQRSILFINQANDSLAEIRLQDLNYISVRDYTAGALRGMLIGGAIGASGAYLAAGHESQSADANLGKGLYTLGGGILGGLAGMTIGMAEGHELIFTFPKDSISVNK